MLFRKEVVMEKIGIDLGGSHIAIGVATKTGKILEKIEKKLKGIVTKEVRSVIEKTIIDAVEKFSKEYNVLEMGIAIPGTVNDREIVKSGCNVYKSLIIFLLWVIHFCILRTIFVKDMELSTS